MSGFDPSELVHAGIAGLTPYEPGKPIEAVAREYGLDEVVKLASNENPWGPSPKAVRRLQEVAAEMHRYPDGPCTDLRDALAQRTGIAANRLIFGNGSAEILELALRTFVQAGQTVASAEVSFSMYGILARAMDARYVTAPMDGVAYDLEALAELVTAKQARLVFVANPNNPTGTAFGADRLHDFLGRIPDGTVVVYDAAYAEYGAAAGIPDGLDLVDRYDNVIVTRTFSKAYGLAGLRVGWAVASPAMADYLNRVRQPFNVNRAAQEAAVAALDDAEFLEMVLRTNHEALAELTEALTARGLRTYDSYANFLLFESPVPADTLFEQLLRRGVIVRSMRGFGLPNHVRVNTGTAAEQQRFLDALDAVLAEAET